MIFRWIDKNAVLASHQRSLNLFGGMPGIRDAGALEAALARPIHKNAYGEQDLANLAAAYAFAIAKAHPFADGNKRAALMTAHAFLIINGYKLEAPPPELNAAVQSLAGSDITEEQFATFLRRNVTK